MNVFKNNTKKNVIKSGALLVCILALANCTDNKKSAADYPANNSAQNKNDASQPNPVDQKENDVDLKITQAIRKTVVDDNAMSIDGKNAKIITANGFVTLRGVVNSEGEKESIDAKAKNVAGVTQVDNQLEVKNP